jgi:asparagine synthase (glutamine-hydrolysing)
VTCAGAETIPELNLSPLARHEAGAYDLALGHRRLSILDLSAAGHGPMSYQDGTFWITYNGEVYNYLELRRELQAKGYTFHTATDTEVVLVAYAEWGPACLFRFNGMWAFAIWDAGKRQLFCARDRFGIKPFHYYWDGQLFAFASEIKALLAHPDIPRRPNDAIIYDYLALGSLDHTNETFFEGIRRLPPSHCLLFDLDRDSLRIQRWWDIEVNPALDDDCLTEDRQLAQFRGLLTDAVRLRLRSDVPIGTCLSGGLDSSSIVCLANHLMLEEGAVPRELVGERQKTFSACFDDPAIDERPYIQQVIEHTGAESNQVFPQGGGGLWEDLERLVWHQEEPFGSTSIYSQWSVMRLAQQCGVTVLLDGQGGDELLAGYHHYLGPFLAQTVRAQGPWITLQTVQAVSAATGQSTALLLGLGLYNSLPGVAQRVIVNLGNARFRTNPTVSESMLQPSFKRQFAERRLVHSKHLGYHNLAERLYQDVFVHSLPALLRYEDRNSMAFSLEARVPFLDYRLVEFCFSLPVTQRIRDGWTKWVLRQAMDGILPEQVRWRRSKLGFATPERQWLQEGIGWVRQLFNQGEVLSEPYLHRQAIRRIRNSPGNGLFNIPGLWRMVNLEVWLRAFWEERIVE